MRNPEPKPPTDVTKEGMSRRSFTDAIGVASVMTVLGFARPAVAQQAAGLLGPSGMHPAGAEPGRIFFTDEEADFVNAAVARLIPSEGEGPGATEANVPNFMDKQLGGAWGKGERLFLGGPYDPSAIPQLGYQLAYTPAEFFRRAIGAINHRLQASGTPFAAMSAEAQDQFLGEQLEQGAFGDLDGVPAKLFFEHLMQMAVEGYFSDPVYGGNKDMVAWKAIGFPGAYDSYRETIGLHGQHFAIGPYSLANHDKIPDPDMKSMESQQ
jgi:gluconate 2-dehydrogenase gamma chain